MSTFGEDLLQSLNEALDHAKGEGSAIVHAPVNPRQVRKQAKLTQAQMAPLMGMSLSGYRKWEQGTRRVSGPAAALLRMVEREPDAVRRTLSWNVERHGQHRDEQKDCLEVVRPESKGATSRGQRHPDQEGEHGHMATTPEDMENWKQIAEILYASLPQIDQALSQANVPVSSRKLWSFDIVRDTMLEVSDQKAFLLSEAHGKFLVIIEDWYRDRYGDAIDEREGDFDSMALIHGTPIAMQVPKRFSLFSAEKNTVWIGYPASVQAEEDPLVWIQNKDAVRALSGGQLETVQESTLETANMVRSISFDLQLLENESNLSVAELAASVRADLQSSARNLCAQNNAALRSAMWDASQATEKALKIFIWRKGQTPRYSHDLSSLADRAEELEAGSIDRVMLARIPSGRAATDLRYGGDITVSNATAVYRAALSITCQVVFEAKPDTKYNWREARFELKKPPWFNFNTRKFSTHLRSM